MNVISNHSKLAKIKVLEGALTEVHFRNTHKVRGPRALDSVWEIQPSFDVAFGRHYFKYHICLTKSDFSNRGFAIKLIDEDCVSTPSPIPVKICSLS